jgi:hypothetical protein
MRPAQARTKHQASHEEVKEKGMHIRAIPPQLGVAGFNTYMGKLSRLPTGRAVTSKVTPPRHTLDDQLDH